MEEIDEYCIISQPQKPTLHLWIVFILFICFFLIFLGGSVADASWTSFFMATLFFMALLTNIAFTMFIHKVYYLSTDKIVIANYKNQYMTELPFNEIYKWNFYTDKKDEYLVVLGQGTSIVINKSNYINFDELVDFFTKTDLVKDTSLKSAVIKNEAIQDELHALSLPFLIILMLSFIFWVITHSKNDSKEILYFQGHIQAVDTNRKSSSIRITLREYPTFSFTPQEEVVAKYGLRNKVKTIGMEARIGVYQSDYDWKINNKKIRMLDINSIPYLYAVSFELSQK